MHQALCLTLWFQDRSILKLLMGRRKEKDGVGSVGEEMVVRLPGPKSRLRCSQAGSFLRGHLASYSSLPSPAEQRSRKQLTVTGPFLCISALQELINVLLSITLEGSIFISIPILQERHRKGTCPSSQPRNEPGDSGC